MSLPARQPRAAKSGPKGPGARMSVFRPGEGLPVSRLLRLSLIQAAAGMTLVLLDGALNRILIVEMHVSAVLVTLMIGAPLVFAPLRAVIGFRSDMHASSLGWRRTPYLVLGAMVQFGGLAIMPFFLLAMTQGHGGASAAIGEAGAMLSFLLAGVGLYATQTTGLALAADIAPDDQRTRVVGLMFVALFCGMIVSALAFRFALQPYAPLRLVKVIQSAAVFVALFNGVAIYRQEAFGGAHAPPPADRPSFAQAIGPILRAPQARRTLAMLALGSAAFGLQEVLVEPFGGQVMHMTVASTTALTGMVGAGSLVGYAVAARRRPGGSDPCRLAALGALAGVPAFVAVILAAPLGAQMLLQAGMAGVGFSAGLFGVAAMNATLALAPVGQSGLALGVWGAVQALAAGLAVAGGGALRALLSHLAQAGRLGDGLAPTEIGYLVMYHLAIALLFAALVAVGPLVGRVRRDATSDARASGRTLTTAMG